jgi:hypothetical protein
MDVSAIERSANRQTYVATSPVQFDSLNSPLKQKLDLYES